VTKGDQSLLHAIERRRPNGGGDGRIGAEDREVIGGSQRELRLDCNMLSQSPSSYYL